MNRSSHARARGAWTIAGTLVALCLAGTAFAQPPAPSPWSEGRVWMFVRAGYAGSNAPASGHGGTGYGFGFSRMLSPSHVNQWSVFGVEPLGFLNWTLFKRASLGVSTQYDVIGTFGSASEIEIPVTLDLSRHFGLNSQMSPYLGFGGGWFYRKSYQTGGDTGRTVPGFYVSGGFNVPIAERQVLGLDVRLASVDGENTPPNPVFGTGTSSALHISAKVNLAFVD